jgi:hypothetical protein
VGEDDLMLMTRRMPPAATFVPSALNATDGTTALWRPRGNAAAFRLAESHTVTVPSSFPLATSDPSGLNATE